MAQRCVTKIDNDKVVNVEKQTKIPFFADRALRILNELFRNFQMHFTDVSSTDSICLAFYSSAGWLCFIFSTSCFSIGVARLQEWMPITVVSWMVSRISSAVAPAFKAFCVCRRTPGAYKCVVAALIAIKISSLYFCAKGAFFYGRLRNAKYAST